MAIINRKTKMAYTDRELKQMVQKATGWDTKQYQKQYDLFRNRAKNYQRITGRDFGAEKIKINELFYKKTISEKKYGDKYRPSALIADIQATTSASSGAKITAAAENTARENILRHFSGFINASPSAQEIANDEKNSAQELYTKLSELAKSTHNAQSDAGYEYAGGLRSKSTGARASWSYE